MFGFFVSNFRMPVIQRNNSAVSSASTVSKNSNVTHCLVQHQDNEKAKTIVHLNQILNPSNRRLKVGDGCTVKGEGRSHQRVKILFYGRFVVSVFLATAFCFYDILGDFETCQHQLDVIGESEIHDGINSY